MYTPWGLLSRGGPSDLAGVLQGVANGDHLRRGLAHLGVGIGVGDDAAPGEQPGDRPVQLGTPQRDAELAVAVAVHPADRTGVPAAVHAFELGAERARGVAGVPPTAAVGCTADASCRSDAGSSGSSVPCTSLARWETLRRAITDGSSGTSSEVHMGRSASASDSTASACSW